MDIKQVLQGIKSWINNNYYDKNLVDQLLSAISSVSCYEVCAELPNEGEGNIIYLLGPIGNGSDKYEEYIYTNSEFIKIGDTSIDLSGYLQDSDIAAWAKASNKPSYSYSEISGTPTNVSSFTNDAGYLTSHQDISGKANSSDLATVATSGDYADLLNKPVIPTIPTNVSDFTNDAGYLTSHQDISGKQDVISDLETIRSGAQSGSTAYQKPNDGIPASDIASGVIPDVSNMVSGDGIENIVSLSISEYEALANKNSETIYVVAEESSYKLYKGSVPINDTYSKSEIDEKIGDIESILATI